jgi:hypothetical protein
LNSLGEYIPNEYCLYENDATYPEKGLRGLNWKGQLKFKAFLFRDDQKLKGLYKKTISKKECYVGPFWGEFGNFLLHFLPFVMHLHKFGIKVHVICLGHYESFFRDENAKVIYSSFYRLSKDFLLDAPNGNSIRKIPAQFSKIYNQVKKTSSLNEIPFFDLFDSNFYWYSFRNWQLNGKQNFLEIHKGVKKKNKVVLFPRLKGPEYTLNNGARLDYDHTTETLADYFDEVVVVGLPEMSANSQYRNPKVRNRIGDNDVVLKECSEASLIVSQHSGAIHVGLYTNTTSLIIYHGVLPIKGLDDSIRFRANTDVPLYLVTSDIKLKEFLTEFKSIN